VLFEPNGLAFRKTQALFLIERSRVADRVTSMITITRSYRTRDEDRHYHFRSTPTLRCRDHAVMLTGAHSDIFRAQSHGVRSREDTG